MNDDKEAAAAAALLDATFATLLARAGEKGDMPGFSQSARSILNALSAETDDDIAFIQTVLSDSALTQRVLRLANSAMYGAFSGEVHSVSRAVQVLGVQTIAHLALGLKVIESLDRSRPETATTQAEMERAVLAGFVGRQLAGTRASLKDTEAVSVCSVLMGLGRMMVSFYLPQVWARIAAVAASPEHMGNPAAEDDAARALLGGSYSDIGRRMAAHWGLPATLTDSLQPCTPGDGQPPETHETWMRMVATAATRTAGILHGQPDDLETALAPVMGTFAAALKFEPADMLAAIRVAANAQREHVQGESPALVRPLTDNERMTRLLRDLGAFKQSAATAGTTQLMVLALELLHTNFGATRSFAFLLFAKEKRYRARFGLGEKAAALLPALQFESGLQGDVFQAVLPREQALYLPDTGAANLKGKLPGWWVSELGQARGFCVIPLHLQRAPVGFLYIDWVPPRTAPAMDAARMRIVAELRETLAACMARPRTAAPAASRATAPPT